MSVDRFDWQGLTHDDLAFLQDKLATETTAYETVLNLRSPGLNLARQPVNCMMCDRQVPFERITAELVRASNTGLVICVNCGRCEGRKGLHTFPVEVIDKQLGRECHYGTLHKGQNHLWIMDRNDQRHGWCATCNNARIEINEVMRVGLDLKGAFKALAEKKKAARAEQRAEHMTVAEPYIKAGLAEPFALAIAAGTPPEEVMRLWESDWWKQYPTDDTLIISVLRGDLTEAEACVINKFRGEHRQLAEACIEQLVPVSWAQMLLESGFEEHPEAVRRVLEGADPALIARIQNLSIADPPPPLGLKIEPKGLGPSPDSASSKPKKDEVKPNPSASGNKNNKNYRVDVLIRVLEAFGIKDIDAFLEHAAAFDQNNNGYLTKRELEAAARAWNPFLKRIPRAIKEMPWFNATKNQICPRCTHIIPRGTNRCASCDQTVRRS